MDNAILLAAIGPIPVTLPPPANVDMIPIEFTYKLIWSLISTIDDVSLDLPNPIILHVSYIEITDGADSNSLGPIQGRRCGEYTIALKCTTRSRPRNGRNYSGCVDLKCGVGSSK